MGAAISGGLLSHDFLTAGVEQVLSTARVPVATLLASAFDRLRVAASASLGPASPPRAVFDVAAHPLMTWLGWRVPEGDAARHAVGWWTTLTAPGAESVVLLVIAWDRAAAGGERAAASLALSHGLRWAFVTNGRVLGLLDAVRAPRDAAIEFDLDRCRTDAFGLTCLRRLAAPDAFLCEPGSRRLTPLRRAIEASDAQGIRVCRSLQQGVRASLATLGAAVGRARRRRVGSDRPPASEQGLTAVYRILFLLFAEARGLVPAWHPVYRDGYTVAALAARVEAGADLRGTWQALQAMARLAHSGCTSGDLCVVPFNGRLFSPANAPLLDHLALDDRDVGKALASLLFTSEAGPRRRISYVDLGVEQLGSVYERLLDDAATSRPGPAVSARKSTGTFYTPRPLTDYLVRAALAPLVAGRSSEDILRLRVLDPAMGSGAFLVAACRFLAMAAERMLVEEGEVAEHDVDEAMQASLRRRVAQWCLFGVDLNPMAVQLAQLSLWLATLSAERPLSFLDHHIRSGDSLIGASPADLIARPPGVRARARLEALPLERFFDASEQLAALLPLRARLEGVPDDSVTVVRDKEQTVATLARHPVLARWRRACDLWCAVSLPEGETLRPLYSTLLDHALGRTLHIQPAIRSRSLPALEAATRVRPLHWPLEFPEVFLDAAGRPRADGGFDAIVGNPPWEMLRADAGPDSGHAALARFARASGLYHTPTRGHVNQYQLFLERAVSLLRPGGRLGMLVPAGLLTDASASGLRERLIDRHGLESVAVFDNRRAIFPIHRSLRFAAVTAIRDGRTNSIRCRVGLDSAEQTSGLDPHTGAGLPVVLTPALLRCLSGTELAFPEVATPTDLVLIERLSARHPALSDPAGWGITFGRELNASDDRDCFTTRPAPSDPVVMEGKHLEPFHVRLDLATRHASRTRLARRLGPRAHVMDEARLAYREVASSTNRVTLIAAILPPGTITVHTVFCRREPMAPAAERVLCGLLNSYVANYWVRRWVTLHVTATVMARLPVPRPNGDLFDELEACCRVLAKGPQPDVESRVQAACAEAYGLDRDGFAHILGTFPLVPSSARQAALDAFTTRRRL